MNKEEFVTDNQILIQIMKQMEELTLQVSELKKENKELKLHLITMHPAYTEEQRQNAMQEIIQMQSNNTLASQYK